MILRGAGRFAVLFASTEHHFTPGQVLELLKSLNTGDISDEAKEEYEADAAKMHAYEALASQRKLTDPEQPSLTP